MNILKPTKTKVLATGIMYVAGIVTELIEAGLFVLFFPNLLSTLGEELARVEEKVEGISAATGIGVSIASVVLEVVVLYVAVCLVVRLLQKGQNRITS